MSTIADRLKNLYDSMVIANSVTNEFVEALPDCYDAVEAKGGTLPATQDSANLPAAIASIPAGADPDELDLTYYFTGAKIKDVYIKTNILTNGSRTLSYCSVENLHMEDVTQAKANSLFRSMYVDNLYIPNLELVWNDFGIYMNINSYILNAPKLTSVGMWFMQYSNIRKAYLPLWASVNGGGVFSNCTDLICVETGASFTGNVGFQSWSPTNALKSDSTSLVDSGETFTSNLEKFLYNIRTYLAANLSSQVTATITFHANVYNAIQADAATVAAFPASWTIASA